MPGRQIPGQGSHYLANSKHRQAYTTHSRQLWSGCNGPNWATLRGELSAFFSLNKPFELRFGNFSRLSDTVQRLGWTASGISRFTRDAPATDKRQKEAEFLPITSNSSQMQKRQSEGIEYSALEFVLLGAESHYRTKIRHPDDTEIHEPRFTQVSWMIQNQSFYLF